MVDAADKIDFWNAVVTSVLITASFAFALGSIYFMAYFNLLEMSILNDIPFSFIVFSMIATFNLTFTVTVLDQLYS